MNSDYIMNGLIFKINKNTNTNEILVSYAGLLMSLKSSKELKEHFQEDKFITCLINI